MIDDEEDIPLSSSSIKPSLQVATDEESIPAVAANRSLLVGDFVEPITDKISTTMDISLDDEEVINDEFYDEEVMDEDGMEEEGLTAKIEQNNKSMDTEDIISLQKQSNDVELEPSAAPLTVNTSSLPSPPPLSARTSAFDDDEDEPGAITMMPVKEDDQTFDDSKGQPKETNMSIPSTEDTSQIPTLQAQSEPAMFSSPAALPTADTSHTDENEKLSSNIQPLESDEAKTMDLEQEAVDAPEIASTHKNGFMMDDDMEPGALEPSAAAASRPLVGDSLDSVAPDQGPIDAVEGNQDLGPMAAESLPATENEVPISDSQKPTETSEMHESIYEEEVFEDAPMEIDPIDRGSTAGNVGTSDHAHSAKLDDSAAAEDIIDEEVSDEEIEEEYEEEEEEDDDDEEIEEEYADEDVTDEYEHEEVPAEIETSVDAEKRGEELFHKVEVSDSDGSGMEEEDDEIVFNSLNEKQTEAATDTTAAHIDQSTDEEEIVFDLEKSEKEVVTDSENEDDEKGQQQSTKENTQGYDTKPAQESPSLSFFDTRQSEIENPAAPGIVGSNTSAFQDAQRVKEKFESDKGSNAVSSGQFKAVAPPIVKDYDVENRKLPPKSMGSPPIVKDYDVENRKLPPKSTGYPPQRSGSPPMPHGRTIADNNRSANAFSTASPLKSSQLNGKNSRDASDFASNGRFADKPNASTSQSNKKPYIVVPPVIVNENEDVPPMTQVQQFREPKVNNNVLPPPPNNDNQVIDARDARNEQLIVDETQNYAQELPEQDVEFGKRNVPPESGDFQPVSTTDPSTVTENALLEKDERHRRSKFRMIFCFCFVVILIVLAFVLALTLPKRGNKNAPAISPSTSPPSPSNEKGFVLTGGPFAGPLGSSYGRATTVDKSLAAVGAPGIGNGTVATYSFKNGQWVTDAEISGDQQDGQFGTSLALLNSNMIVGAPEVYARQTNTPTGKAYVFEYQPGLVSGTWQQVGPSLRGLEDIDAANEEFGFSVGLSNTLRAVVGAPQRLSGNGGVYTFDYINDFGNFEWKNLTVTPLNITDTGGAFGTSVAISRDGSRILVSAPRIAKYFVYQWDDAGSQWMLIHEGNGINGDSSGYSLAFISDNGDAFAVGVPGATKSRVRRGRHLQSTSSVGRIDVFGQDSVSSKFQQLGTSIYGGEEGHVGGCVAGNTVNAPGNYAVLMGTSTGMILRYDYNTSSKVWEQLYETIDSGKSGQVTGLAVTNEGNVVVGGIAESASAAMYELDGYAPATENPVPTSKLVPTIAPSSAPSLNQLSWKQIGSPFSGASNLGLSVALSAEVIAAGGSFGFGQVVTFSKTSNGSYTGMEELSGYQDGSLFGTSVDVNEQDYSLLVGAPGVYATGTTTPTGGAYVYTLDSSRTNWTLLGSVIRGTEDIYAAGEAFGFSVAMSNGNVLAIGAPWNNINSVTKRGRVYVFNYNSVLWEMQNSTLLLGDGANDLLGSAVDISADGSTILAGAPGSNSGAGRAMLYTWSGSSWNVAATFNASTPSESFGTSVKILTSDGGVVAVGGPGYGSSNGVVRAYQKDASGSYVQFGSDIVGDSGEAIGGTNSLSGSDTVIMTGTSGGAVKTYGYESDTKVWGSFLATVDTGLLSTPSLSGSGSLLTFVAGSQNSVVIYSLVS